MLSSTRRSSVSKKSITLTLIALVLGACGGGGAGVVTTPETTVTNGEVVTSTGPVETTVPGFEFTGDVIDTYVQNAAEFAGSDAADWDNAEVVQVELSEMAFTPSSLRFEAGKPYKVELVNVGALKHEVAAEHFFASVAWRKVESEQSEIKAPFFREIEVLPGQTVELFFVPISTGTFDVVCEIEGHLEAGMFGSIEVVGTPPTSPAPILTPIDEGPWVANGEELVAAADWDAMETLEIEMGEFFFAPNEIHLTVGQPYNLVFVNSGGVKHEATAGGLFETIAFRKAQDASGEYKAPTLAEVETFAGAETEIFLIPQEAGSYELVCEIEGHFEAGMFGSIVVDAA
jgi:uncharacterized cupredoxin-like copper-binding protein